MGATVNWDAYVLRDPSCSRGELTPLGLACLEISTTRLEIL
jgi:hypothetical protein